MNIIRRIWWYKIVGDPLYWAAQALRAPNIYEWLREGLSRICKSDGYATTRIPIRSWWHGRPWGPCHTQRDSLLWIIAGGKLSGQPDPEKDDTGR